MNLLWPYLAGALTVGVGYLLAAAFTGCWQPLRLAEGADGRLSVSKLQWLLWTAVVVFGYVATVVARSLNGGDITTGVNLPSNLLIAMGFSTATMATAKGITTLYVASGRVVKPPVSPAQPAPAGAAPAAPAAGAAAVAPGAAAAPAVPQQGAATSPTAASYLSDLVQDDANQSDLSKVQLLLWTAIALGIFLVNVILNVNAIKASHMPGDTSLPDIDGALMVLMGLSQGGYLGKKLVTSNRLQLATVAPPTVSLAGDRTITLLGSGFGAASPLNASAPEDPSSMLLLGGYQATNVTAWSDTRIVATLDPARDPAIGAARAKLAADAAANPPPAATPTQDIAVSVQVAGQVPRDAAGNQQTITLTLTP